METNKELMLREVEMYKNTLILGTFTVEKLIDFAEDDEDYYYVIQKLNGEIYWLSGVCILIFLKNLPPKQYDLLEHWWSMNCCK